MSYKKSTVLQISGLNERTGGKSGIKWKMKLTHFGIEFKEKCETMIHIFKHRKGQTYEQIKLAKNRLFLFTCFNPLSPNSDQHQFSSDSQYPYKVKRLGF